MPEPRPVIDRRAAIGGAATVSAAAVAVALLPAGRGAAPERSAQAPEAVPAAPGYRLTDHIRQYYARARIWRREGRPGHLVPQEVTCC